LLGELLAAARGATPHLLKDRLLGTMVGRCFAIAASGVRLSLQTRLVATSAASNPSVTRP
jgi:hypothetical protein